MAEESTRAETILVVDDNHAVRVVTAAMLRRAHYEVIEAESGEEALRLFREHKSAIRVIVSDVVMPGMPGPTLVQRLVDLQPGLCVLFISGYVSCAPSALKLDRDHVAFLGKPFNREQLVSEVQKLAAHAASGSVGSSAVPMLDDGQAATRTVLIIDDAVTVGRHASILDVPGLKVMTATTTEAGLRRVVYQPADMVIVELRMPDMDGVEFVRRLRKLPARRASVTVLTSDYYLDDQIVRDLKALDAEIYFKPIWPDDLLAIARGWRDAASRRNTLHLQSGHRPPR